MISFSRSTLSARHLTFSIELQFFSIVRLHRRLYRDLVALHFQEAPTDALNRLGHVSLN